MDGARKKPIGGSRYGLQLKISTSAAKKPQLKKPVPFSLEDDDEYSVEDDIARQASKKQSAHEVDVQIKQSLEQDASAFDYDGVYDQMKGQQAQPIREDRAKRESKYIKSLLDKAKLRAVEQDMAYERRLTKEREKDDHLYEDKDKFVTNAYKKKLIEMGKWKEDERLRDEREKAHEVSGKKDLSDFYRNLLKHNVAFGAGKEKARGADKDTPSRAAEPETASKLHVEKELSDYSEKQSNTAHSRHRRQREDPESRSPLASPKSKQNVGQPAVENLHEVSGSGTNTNLPIMAEQNTLTGPPKVDGLLPSGPASDWQSKEDAVATARERYLARRREKTQG